jgi:hypothetical protein
MWVYPGPGCPDCTLSAELANMEINTRGRGVRIHEADLNFGSIPYL